MFDQRRIGREVGDFRRDVAQIRLEDPRQTEQRDLHVKLRQRIALSDQLIDPGEAGTAAVARASGIRTRLAPPAA